VVFRATFGIPARGVILGIVGNFPSGVSPKPLLIRRCSSLSGLSVSLVETFGAMGIAGATDGALGGTGGIAAVPACAGLGRTVLVRRGAPPIIAAKFMLIAMVSPKNAWGHIRWKGATLMS
jgi:hypothetical protein